ncbi:hypothetical protein SAMN02745121_06644 [Nannocystis exedens]|uniref:Uncharacterized protein n=1 Tax=Nannocystis exedens TaxID=54 RepID=A0A1I2FF84_9BACT|nr:hypothetical protein NAEX_03491 [Nannocystis exedens]SFF04164.1 hypothetical protein SAMN02745121_06644 [Nannocystis exedens]
MDADEGDEAVFADAEVERPADGEQECRPAGHLLTQVGPGDRGPAHADERGGLGSAISRR